MATPYDENALDPAQYEALARARAESAQQGFTPDTAGYQATATGEIAPLYSDILGGVDTSLAEGIGKTNQSYDDLLKNIRDTYNARGTFFSGDATGAENKAQTARATSIAGLTSDAAARKSSILMDQGNRIAARAAQIQEQAFNDYVTKRKAAVDQQVFTDLATYIPKHATIIQQQLQDENSPWLDIPVDGDTAVPTDTGTDTTTQPPIAKQDRKFYESQGFHYIGTEAAKKEAIRKYGVKRVVFKNGNYYWK